MRMIPAMDLIDGKCVRLTKGDYTRQKTYSEQPLEMAKMFEDAGITYLHLVDLDGAKSNHIVNIKTLELLATKTNLSIDFGGGIKSSEDVRLAFESGAEQLIIGSIAIQNPELMSNWIDEYGQDKIILGADCKNRKIVTNGWMKSYNTEVISFIQHYEKSGIQYCMVTDIDKDGMLGGPAVLLYQEIVAKTKIKLIASGGISSIHDLEKLKKLGCEGVIIGKAIYEGLIDIKELGQLC